jgi:hypothetical protein
VKQLVSVQETSTGQLLGSYYYAKWWGSLALRGICQTGVEKRAPFTEAGVHVHLVHVQIYCCYKGKLTPWSRVLLEKLTVTQLVKIFLACYGTQTFIPVFTTARYWSLS